MSHKRLKTQVDFAAGYMRELIYGVLDSFGARFDVNVEGPTITQDTTIEVGVRVERGNDLIIIRRIILGYQFVDTPPALRTEWVEECARSILHEVMSQMLVAEKQESRKRGTTAEYQRGWGS
jgi:hypothetical protein